MTDDNAWKELLEYHLEQFFALVCPDIHADIDWTKGYTSLEQELRPDVPDASEGTRIADKFIKAYRKNTNDERYFHLEIQGKSDADFPYRVYLYNRRGVEKSGSFVVSIAILADRSRNWWPPPYRAEQYGVVVGLKYRRWKLLRQRSRVEALRAAENPVAIFILAALEAKRTRRADPAREAAKLELIRLLRERRMEDDEARYWYRYIDWLLPLVPEAQRRFIEQSRRMGQEQTMPFVTGLERTLRRELREELTPAIREELTPAIREELKELLTPTIREELRLETLRQMLPVILSLRFGPDGTSFAAEIASADLARREAVFAAAPTAASLDGLRRLS